MRGWDAVLRYAGSTLVLVLVGTALACSEGTAPDTDLPVDSPPVASIDRPGEGTTFRAGDVIVFIGGATDAEEGQVPAERLTWWIDLHHDDHTHPFVTATAGVDSGTVEIPTRGETDDDIWYRIYLEATDLQSASDTVYREIFPEKSTLTFRTEPPGLRITLDGMPRVTPISVLAVEGLERDIGMVTPQTLDGQSYAFDAWTHGGDASQTVVTPTTDSIFVATFASTGTNQSPTVTLTSPVSGTTVTVGTEVTVTADASDADGAVVQVDFLVDGTLVGSDDAAPYSAQWTPSAAAVYRLTARATDDGAAVGLSDTVQVTVVSGGGGDVIPPTIELTGPADQATGLTGAVVLRATASDDIGVAGVQFQVDGEDVGEEVTSEPYEVELPSTSVYASGVHVVRARARDAAGNLSAWSSATVTFGGSEALPQGFAMSPYGAQLPGLGTNLAFAPDGRLFVALKNGGIRVIMDGELLSEEFARLSVDEGGERGLLGIAFHPDFATNGWVYVHYLTTDGGTESHARLARFTASGDVAAGAEEVLVTFPTDENIFHNGGEIHFGPDGNLYVAVGDDATPANSQSLANVFGKLLRFNDDGSIPSDNPFYGSTTGLNRAIWALGLRNPFTFAFQPGTGRVFINDVGGFRWEEVNEGFRGANYGWPDSEGPTTDPRFVSPLFSYEPHAGLVTGSSIVGAAFYDPPVAHFPPAYAGQYFFGDYVANWVHRLDPDNGNAVYRFASVPAGVTGLAVGPDGALYVLVANSFTSAQVHRISYAP
jgi:glucose/arabinose dehydrogenase